MDKNDNNANIGSRGFTIWKQKNPVKKVTPSWNRTQASHNLWFQVQHSPFWTKLTFAWKTETLGSLYSHALLILTESSKSKNQVVYNTEKVVDLLFGSFNDESQSKPFQSCFVVCHLLLSIVVVVIILALGRGSECSFYRYKTSNVVDKVILCFS